MQSRLCFGGRKAILPLSDNLQASQKSLDVYIFHGTLGHPQENWFPSLKKDLEAQGHRVTVPQFPTPEGQTLENWLKVIDPLRPQFGSNTVMVGHSIGAVLILHLLARLEKPAKAAFLVAGFLEPLGMPDYDHLFETFIRPSPPLAKAMDNVQSIQVFQSDNDPYVPMGHGRELARKLHVDMTLVNSAGHFNEAAGYVKFDRLFNEIVNLDRAPEDFLAFFAANGGYGF